MTQCQEAGHLFAQVRNQLVSENLMAKRRTTSHESELGKKSHKKTEATEVSTETLTTEPAAVPNAEPHAEGMAGPGMPETAAELSDYDPPRATPASWKPRVLDVFFIDSGWNNPVCTAVRENLPAVAEYLQGHRFFVMTPQQSMSFIRRHPALIGEDPILLVLDRAAAVNKNSSNSCGFRLSLGSVRNPEAAVSMLKWAIQLTMTANSAEMANIISKSAHRETLQGVIELMGEGSSHLIEFAPL
jgi:hypothetical protein